MQMLPGHTADRLRVGQSVETSPRRPHDHRALVRIAEQMRRDCGVTPEELDPGRPARKPRVATTHARDITRGFDGASRARWAFSGTETVKEWVGIVDPLRIGMGRRVGSARIVVERSRLCRSDCGIHWIKERQASVIPEPFLSRGRKPLKEELVSTIGKKIRRAHGENSSGEGGPQEAAWSASRPAMDRPTVKEVIGPDSEH